MIANERISTWTNVGVGHHRTQILLFSRPANMPRRSHDENRQPAKGKAHPKNENGYIRKFAVVGLEDTNVQPDLKARFGSIRIDRY